MARTFLKTVRHFFPELADWLDQLPDTRYEPMIQYHRRFLSWWGLLLFGLGLGSRRSADSDLRDLECAILHNLNQLAGTQQQSLPVTKTLDHFIGHVGGPAFAQLLHRHNQRLIRMKALDDFRCQGHFIVAVDGTGYLSFSHHHCDQCLTQLGHLLMQLLHHNSLHRTLANQYGHNSVRDLWGALKKIPQRLLDAFRYYLLQDADFDTAAAAGCHISLNSS